MTLELPSAMLEDHFGRFVFTFQKAVSARALKIVSRASLVVANKIAKVANLQCFFNLSVVLV